MSSLVQILFHKAGLQTTIQDSGRWGYQHLGIPVGGTMDKAAARKANWLVGNKATAPVLEITMLGPVIEFKGAAQIAITGADISPVINKKKAPMYQTINLKPSSILSFGALQTGCRAYLAIGGDWQVAKWLSSSSSILSGTTPLLPQSNIQAQQIISIQPKTFISKRHITKEQRPSYTNLVPLRVLRGPEFETFSRTSIAAFFSLQHRVSNHSNRMGYRLETILPDCNLDEELISSGIIPGTIQVSSAGQPILLMNDAPTTGGYYRIATICSEDLDKVAQLKPKDLIYFQLKI